MASYQARRRDPLVDQKTQAAIERRGKELMGAALLGLGLVVGLMLVSYSPDDPSWFTASDQPVQNLLGRIGAAIAAPLYVIAGRGAWGVALVLVTWGVRFMAHRGEERAMGRAIFAPIAIAVLSVAFAAREPGADWNQVFGYGGMFGDTVFGSLMGVVPASGNVSFAMTGLLLMALAMAMMLFVLGFDRRELVQIGRRALFATILSYDRILRALTTGAAMSARTAQGLQDRHRARREAQEAERAAALARYSASAGYEAEAEDFASAAPAVGQRRASVLRAEPRFGDVGAQPLSVSPEPVSGGLFSGLLRRFTAADPVDEIELEPELVEQAPSEMIWQTEAPSAERIRSRIADAVKARGSAPSPSGRVEPPLSKPSVQPLVTSLASAPLAPAMEGEPLEEWDEADVDAFSIDPDANYAPAPARLAQPGGFAAADAKRSVIRHSARKPAPSRQAEAESQPRLKFEEPAGPAYELPPLSLLSSPTTIQRHQLSDEALEENARMLESVLDDYGVKGDIVSVRPGPVVTMYELEPAPGLKASRVIGLADDIARSMSALSARVSTVPGRSVIGIELPNAHREKVVLREILSARDFGDGNHKLPLALGKDIAGQPVVANLAKMPHLLIAGTTGSGKSVAINTMILSLLYKLSPEECRLIMIDPKMLELSVYDGIPHLLSPVVTDPKKAVVALKWVVGEMEERYRKMSKMGVRNIDGYNGRVKEALDNGEMFKRTVQTGFDEDTGDPIFETEEIEPKKLPYIVVIVDEMADLMMVAGKEIEACIQRLAQMARASGIHLIMATQRPSVDVITGTIKANFPTRISFQVTSKIDSRTILGEMGAEQLLGMGDMLYMAGGSRITRIHGPFVSDEEVEEIVTHLKSFGPPEYMSGVVDGPDKEDEADIDLVLGLGGGDGDDALYDQAVAVVLKDRKVSTSYIQRKLGIGYNKAARLVEQMEEEGLVSSANHVGKREILVPEQ
ncbi:DNA translocase FtsK 4TM domain-containing protein [Frigidibacter sp. RF13]|uniref:DNA translocase FtsK n=1 Tax=Frigidibacter sp. RF13 TaxID=2997340 RepID=UPI00226F754B|nr:DNA translocase FtsK [Frigidibacter sp. RF13]MCY1126574.1 DNA translocase FtsK 4TM domain-containing protein [Frigidibacter sp. RF13]